METGQLVRYWHPRGGWYYGKFQDMKIDDDGNGIAIIACFGLCRTVRVPEGDVFEEVA